MGFKTAFAFIGDLACLAVVILPAVILDKTGEPYQRGFFCNDETIRHPYKDSTISSGLYKGMSTVLPFFTVIFVEMNLVHNCDAKNLKKFFSSAYSILVVFFFGYYLNQLLTGITKLTIGRLRPHFLAVCNPGIEFTDAVCGSPYNPRYITDYSCLGSPLFPTPEDKISHIKDARMSFLSGHSSTVCYAMLFTVLYIQRRLKTRYFQLPKAGLQVFCIVFAFITFLSRISDYKHHPEDVICGILLGCIEAAFSVFIILPKSMKRFNFCYERGHEKDDPSLHTPLLKI